MEARLIAFARQRREAMGGDFELPPVAQEALLAEATRKYRPETAPAPSAWAIFWRRLAWTGAIAGVALLMLVPMLRRTPAPAPHQAINPDQTSLVSAAGPPAQPLALALADRPVAGPAATLPAVSAEAGSARENPAARAERWR